MFYLWRNSWRLWFFVSLVVVLNVWLPAISNKLLLLSFCSHSIQSRTRWGYNATDKIIYSGICSALCLHMAGSTLHFITALSHFTCMSFLLLQPCSSLLFWLWSDTSVLASFADDAGSAASETFIVSVSTLSDILIAKSYREMLANTEDLKDRNVSMRASIFGRERSSDDYAWRVSSK